MIKKTLKVFAIIVVTVTTMVYCKPKDFYYDSVDGEILRVPLIKPHYVFSPNSGVSWFYEFSEGSSFHGIQINEIKFLGLKDSIIILKTDSCYLPTFSTEKSNHWFIINTKTRSEEHFFNELNYNNAIDSLKISSIKLFKIEEVFDKFDKSGLLPEEWNTRNSE